MLNTININLNICKVQFGIIKSLNQANSYEVAPKVFGKLSLVVRIKN